MKKQYVWFLLILGLAQFNPLIAQNKKKFPVDELVFFPPTILGYRRDIKTQKDYKIFWEDLAYIRRTQFQTETNDQIDDESKAKLELFEKNFAKYERALLPDSTHCYDALGAIDSDGDPEGTLLDFYLTYPKQPQKELLKDIMDEQKGKIGVFLWGYYVQDYLNDRKHKSNLRLCILLLRKGSMNTIYEKNWELKGKAWDKENVAKSEIKTIYEKFKFHMKYYYRE